MNENQIAVKEVGKENYCPLYGDCKVNGELEYLDYCKKEGTGCSCYESNKRFMECLRLSINGGKE